MRRMAAGKHAGHWTRLQVGWLDCPHLQTEANRHDRMHQVQRLGKDDPFILSYLEGRVGSKRSEDHVFSADDMARIELAIREGQNIGTDLEVPFIGERGEFRAATDASGGGEDGDGQLLYIREGNLVLARYEFNDTNGVRVANQQLEIVRSYGILPHQWYIDGGGGYGKIIADQVELPVAEGGGGFYGIHKYLNNNAPRQRSEFADRFTQDHAHFRRLLSSMPIAIADGGRLKRDMHRRKWSKNDKGVMQLEPKKVLRRRGEDSPDDLDCIVMLFADWFPDRGKRWYPKRPRKTDPNDIHYNDFAEALSRYEMQQEGAYQDVPLGGPAYGSALDRY